MTDEEVVMKLAKDAMKHNLTHDAIRDQALLINAASGRKIPIDPRTILRTRTETVGEVQFVHFGLVKCIVLKVKKGVHPVPVYFTSYSFEIQYCHNFAKSMIYYYFF